MANGYHQVVTIKLSETDVVSLRIALENALRAWKAGGFNVEGAAPTSAIGDTASLLEELRHVMHGSKSQPRVSFTTEKKPQ